MTTLLCVPIPVHEPESALAAAAAAKAAGADLVEFRVDEFFTGEAHQAAAVEGLVADSPLPCIVTCRLAAEGGQYEGDEGARVGLYERLAMAMAVGVGGEPGEPPRYIDVEAAAYTPEVRRRLALAMEHPEQVRDRTTSLILSMHDFGARPADLTRQLLKMRETPAAVLKVAYRARSLRDNLELFDLLAERDRPMVALGMGEFGLMSRVLAPKFGGFLTFASLRPETATAPGQPTVKELLELYRFRAIGPRTAVYGVVGYPLGHSLSPRVHNAGFGATGHDGVYLPLPVIEGYESFKATVGELVDHPRLGLRGLSVTLPHKENLVRLAREMGWGVDGVAAAVGAGNTLIVERDGSGNVAACRVVNTDVPALVEWARGAAGDLAGKRVAVAGAGGVGRAAAYGLKGAGASVRVFNRTRARAEELAAAAGVEAGGLEELAGEPWDVLVNCTEAGMAGGVSEGLSVVREEDLSNKGGRGVVLDTVYNPEETPLLRAARGAGLSATGGLPMFVGQAELQFLAWTGVRPPTGLFARIASGAIREPAG